MTQAPPNGRAVVDLNLTDGCPAKQIWNPIFEAAALHNETIYAIPNVGSSMTLLLPACVMADIRSHKLRCPATQAFNVRFLVFADNS